MRRSRVAAPRRNQTARAGPHTWRLGEPSRRLRDAGRAFARGTLERRVLPDADRFSSHPIERRTLREGGRAAGADASGPVRAVLLPLGESEDALSAQQLPPGTRRRAET